MKSKVLYILLSLVIATGLWLYVVTVVNPGWEETYYNIPVVLENEDILISNGLMLTTDERPTVTLRLSGNRKDMIELNSSNITLIADLSKISSAGEQALSYRIVYPGGLTSSSFEIISQNPQQVTLSISEWKSKELDIGVEYTGKVPDQFVVFKEDATMDTSKITVTGPSGVIDRITQARIHVDLEGKQDNISDSFEVFLYDAQGELVQDEQVKTSVEQVRYTLKIQRWKDIELRLDVIEDTLLTKNNCQITIDPVTVRVSGSEKVLAQLDYLVLGQVRLSDLTGQFEATYELEMPEGVKNLSGVEQVSVSIQIPELEMRTFTVTQIRSVNVPGGMKVTMITKEKKVTLRAEKDVLDALTADDVSIIVDFTNAEAGNATYKASVTLPSYLSSKVGIVGTYDVTATVTAEKS